MLTFNTQKKTNDGILLPDPAIYDGGLQNLLGTGVSCPSERTIPEELVCKGKKEDSELWCEYGKEMVTGIGDKGKQKSERIHNSLFSSIRCHDSRGCGSLHHKFEASWKVEIRRGGRGVHRQQQALVNREG